MDSTGEKNEFQKIYKKKKLGHVIPVAAILFLVIQISDTHRFINIPILSSIWFKSELKKNKKK